MNGRAFPRLFSPLDLRGHRLRNRIVFGAHTANMAVEGLPTGRHLAYYEERAIGGAAMLVIEPMPVHAAAVLTRGNFRHGSDEVISHFRRITEAVHAHGALIVQQLYHVGQHGDADNSFHPPDALVGKELQHAAVDHPLRRRLAGLGVDFVCESAILEWTGEGARVVSFLSDTESFIAADDLVLATPNRAEDTLARELGEDDIPVHLIGDAAAPRQAPYAIYDGRAVALGL